MLFSGFSGQEGEVILFSEVNYKGGGIHLLCLLSGAVSSGVPLSFNSGVFGVDQLRVLLKGRARGIRRVVAFLKTIWAPVEVWFVFITTIGVGMDAPTHRACRDLSCALFSRVTMLLAIVAPKVGYLARIEFIVLVSLNSKWGRPSVERDLNCSSWFVLFRSDPMQALDAAGCFR